MKSFPWDQDKRDWLNSAFASVALDYFVPNNKGILITARGKTDGMAAQACAIYSAMLFARATGNQYRHSPLLTVAHKDENDKHWEHDVERYFSFGLDENEVPHHITTFNLDKVSSILKFMLLSGFYRFMKREILIEKQHFHEYGNRHPDDYLALAERLRSKFYADASLHKPLARNGRLQVACHIRRGDVNQANHPERFTSNQQIANQLAGLAETFCKLKIPYDITICSQGHIGEFDGLSEYGEIRLDGTAFDDFQALAGADILITAKSCFSYCAALLSEGVVIYEPFYHKPLSSWFDCSGKFFNNPRFISSIQKIPLTG